MARPRGEPSTVLRLPTALVARIDQVRGELSRADFLARLVPRERVAQWIEMDEPAAPGEGRASPGRAAPARGSRSPSLERFGG